MVENQNDKHIPENFVNEILGVASSDENGGFHIPRKKLPHEFGEQFMRELDEILLLHDFTSMMCYAKILMYNGEQGSGNSSAKPKTLGEIAQTYITSIKNGLMFSIDNPKAMSWDVSDIVTLVPLPVADINDITSIINRP